MTCRDVVHLAAGPSVDQKQALMKDITDAVVKNLGVAPDRVVVLIVESAKTLVTAYLQKGD